MSLADAVVGLKAYKEVEERMEQLWRNLDAAVVSPRMDTKNASVPSVQVQGETLQLSGQGDQSVESLFSDLETVIVFLNKRLPPDLLTSLARFMMADIIPRLVQQCLNSAVPTSLKDMDKFQATIERARQFYATLENNGYTGFDELKHWVDNAPLIWLGKCRESSLAAVRSRLLGGIGEAKQVEKVEKQMVSISEGKELSKSTKAAAVAEGNDWGDAWGEAWDDDDGQPKEEPREEPKAGSKAPVSTESKVAEDDGADAWGWDDDATEDTSEQKKEDNQKDGNDEDDSAAAWGWGDEDTTQEPEVEYTPKPIQARAQEETRELVLRETYSISSMPEPVLELIYAILEDAAKLTREDGEYSHVTATAPGLFGLPTFALALFRGISPYYYSLADGGNM
jgi:centromere/kinetochore protein ZW10